MKNLFLTFKIITLSVVTVFLLTGCSSDDGGEDYIDMYNILDGIWKQQDNGGLVELVFDGNNLDLSLSGTPLLKGTVKATPTKITIDDAVVVHSMMPGMRIERTTGNYVLDDNVPPEYFVLSKFSVQPIPVLGTLNINGTYEKQ
jgi:hypothetical protein